MTTMYIATSSIGAFTATNALDAVTAVKAFWTGLGSLIPNEVSILVQPTVDQYDDTTGILNGTIVATPSPTPSSGTASGNYLGGAGFRIDWNTGQILGGRRFRGRTYVVPAAASAFDVDGSVLGATFTTINTACTTLLSTLTTKGLGLAVWHKEPTAKSPVRVAAPVVSHTVPDKSAIMRSRRD